MSRNRHIYFCRYLRRASDNTRDCCGNRAGKEVTTLIREVVRDHGLNVPCKPSGCLDGCEFGPMIIVYPERIRYAVHTKEDIEEIIEKHLKGGKIVERLQVRLVDGRWIPNDKRLLAEAGMLSAHD